MGVMPTSETGKARRTLSERALWQEAKLSKRKANNAERSAAVNGCRMQARPASEQLQGE